MSDSTPVKNRLIPAGAQMMSAWLVNDGCDFMKLLTKYCKTDIGGFRGGTHGARPPYFCRLTFKIIIFFQLTT